MISRHWIDFVSKCLFWGHSQNASPWTVCMSASPISWGEHRASYQNPIGIMLRQLFASSASTHRRQHQIGGLVAFFGSPPLRHGFNKSFQSWLAIAVYYTQSRWKECSWRWMRGNNCCGILLRDIYISMKSDFRRSDLRCKNLHKM